MFESAVGLLLAVSIASERLVEIVKGLVPYLNEARSDAREEARRKVALQVLAIFSGIVTTLLAEASGSLSSNGVPAGWTTPIGIVTLGILASGGSSLWNTVLSYLLQVKNLKKIEVENSDLAARINLTK